MPDPRGGRELTQAMLLVASGLPGAGKTTLARRAASALGATYLRIDTVEEAIAGAGLEVGPLGYTIAYALALDNLKNGNIVIADCVNAIEITRAEWRAVADAAGAFAVEVEIVCSDEAEHKRRVEARLVGGRCRPTWADVLAREYEPWTRPVHRVETAGRTEEECLRRMLAIVCASRNEKAPPDGPAGPF